MSNIELDETIESGNLYSKGTYLEREAFRVVIISGDDGNLESVSIDIGTIPMEDGEDGEFEDWLTWGVNHAEKFHAALGEAIEKAKTASEKFITELDEV